jgi:hypothetical protein
MRRLARVVGRSITSIALGVGWLAALTAAALFIVEKSGLLTTVVRDTIARRAGPFGAELALDDARLSWFEPALVIAGLSIGPRGEALRLERIELHPELSFEHGLRLSSVDVRGGRVRLARTLEDMWHAFSTDVTRRGSITHGMPAIPVIHVRDLAVEVETRRFGVLPVGRVDALLSSETGGRPVLAGRMVPSLAPISSPDVSARRTSGEIFLSGRETREGEFELKASASRVPLSTDSLPQGTPLDALRPYRPQGLLALQAQGQFSMDDRIRPSAHVRVSISDASCVAAGARQQFDALSFDAEGDYAPPSNADLLAPSAWRGTATLRGRWNGVDMRSNAILGDEADRNTAAKVWLHFARFPLDHALIDLFGDSPSLNEYWNAFEAQGRCETWLGLSCPSGWTPGDALGPTLCVGLEAAFTGDCGMTYHGWKNPRSGETDQGFPLPLEHMTGAAVYARDPRRERPFQLGLIDLEARHASGTLRGSGWIGDHPVTAPPYLPGYGYAELDLRLISNRLDVDDRLRAALRGLRGSLDPDDSWQPYQPSGGRLHVDVRLLRTAEMRYLATRVTLDLEDVDLAWKELPVPVSKAHGKLVWLADGKSERGLSVSFDGALSTARSAHMTMRFQTDTSAQSAGIKALDGIEWIDVNVLRLSLTGSDKKILVTQNTRIGTVLDLLNSKGFADVHYALVRCAADGELAMAAEITPSDTVQLTPRTFTIPTSDVRGRVIVSSALEPDAGTGTQPAGSTPSVRARVTPFVGTWPKDVALACTLDYPDGDVRIFGAGVDLSNKSLLGALGSAFQAPDGASAVDLSALTVQGALDFEASMKLGGGALDAATSRGRLFLRGSSLSASASSFRLDDLVGVLEIKEKALRGGQLAARLGGTPVVLKDVLLSSTAEGSRLESRFSTDGFPLDAEHLRLLLDPKTLDALLGELHLRGRIDVGDGRFALISPRQGESRIELSGKVTPNDMSLQLGVPLSIRSASASIDKLILTGGRVRAVLRIDDLYGEIADRKLERANLLLTYVQPRLSIESLSGQFEGGEIRPLGESSARGGTVFSLDLEEPYPFQLALELRAVEVGSLVHGLFPSNIAAKGQLDCRLRLTGDTEDLLGIQGSGSISVRHSRLWSVPVFRALLSQIGLGDEAVFDSMASNFRIKNGVIYMNDNAVNSQVVQLVGDSGELDLDGRMKFDLDLHYAIVDRLGPIRRLLYSIQNSLLSVQIRGDMSRPEVILRNPIGRLFSGNATARRQLPLPEFARLPARF